MYYGQAGKFGRYQHGTFDMDMCVYEAGEDIRQVGIFFRGI
jgi:hypothetical protein